MRHSHAHGEDLINIASRPKGLRDASTGKRPQLSTVRHLPPRRQAIGHAWDNELITDEEFRSSKPLALLMRCLAISDDADGADDEEEDLSQFYGREDSS